MAADDPVLTTMGERLRFARSLVEISARELDRLSSLAEGHVSMIEAGRRPVIESKTAEDIAGVLGLSLDWLISGKGKAPTATSAKRSLLAARGLSTGTDG